MIAQNICHAAVLAGYSVLFRSAAALLEELHRQSPEGRRAKLRPNATCIVTLLDRLLHHADVTVIEGNSYRVRESEQETAARRRKK